MGKTIQGSLGDDWVRLLGAWRLVRTTRHARCRQLHADFDVMPACKSFSLCVVSLQQSPGTGTC